MEGYAVTGEDYLNDAEWLLDHVIEFSKAYGHEKPVGDALIDLSARLHDLVYWGVE